MRLVSSLHLRTHVRMESWEWGLSPQTPQSLSRPHSEGYSQLGGTAMAHTVASWRREPIQALARHSCRPSIVRCSDFFSRETQKLTFFKLKVSQCQEMWGQMSWLMSLLSPQHWATLNRKVYLLTGRSQKWEPGSRSSPDRTCQCLDPELPASRMGEVSAVYKPPAPWNVTAAWAD